MTSPSPIGEGAREIAEKLTKAQQRWLLSAEPTLEKVEKKPTAKWWDNPRRLYVTIDGKDHWLGCRGMRSPEGAGAFTSGWEQLNETGLAVRSLLASTQVTKDGEPK